MKSKSTKSSDEKQERQNFELFEALAAIDRKDYEYYDSLSEEQKKKFVPYMLLQWTSTVKANQEIQNFYLLATEYAANKHMFNEHVQNHPELQWKMLCASSPGIGKQFHQWIPSLGNSVSKLTDSVKLRDVQDYLEKIYKNYNKQELEQIAENFAKQINHQHKLAKLYGNLKISDVKILSELVTEQDIINHEKESGN